MRARGDDAAARHESADGARFQPLTTKVKHVSMSPYISLETVFMSQAERVERPHLVWWIVILTGLTLLGFQGFSDSFYAWWVAHVNALPAKSTMAWIFLACIPLHVGEALYCWRLSNRLGTPGASAEWALQTLVIGFPSTRLLMKRARPGASALHRSAASP
jgi:hypothetical protein